jgi:hypothetical protein
MAATNEAKNMTTQKSVSQDGGRCLWLSEENGACEPLPPGGSAFTMAVITQTRDLVKPFRTALRLVSFRYQKEIDPQSIPQFGLVAEEVEKVDPDLVTRNDKGDAEAVRYEAVNAMLLNEFLKEHRKVQQQEATITQLNKDFRTTVTQLTARLDEQAAQIQKVSTQLELSKAAPQTVKNTD